MATKYVISVDNLDLSLLPLAYQPRRDITPLWKNSDELSEFTIHIGNTSPSKQNVPEESTPRTQAIETTVCHMCKADVPKQFFKEHKNSPKHKTYTKIANIALQRITEHISDGSDCDETEVDTLTYFCSHCSVVVNICEQKSHENSHSHKNSVFLDKSLSNFLDLYTNFDKTANDSAEISDATVPKSVNEDIQFDLKSYLNILKDKYKMLMKFNVIDEEKLEIEVDGSRLEVAAQNFHGLKTTSIDNIECVVCKEAVKVKDKLEHIMSPKHMYRVSTPFKDIHCKREIYPSWHHCILCNVITDDSDIHIISDQSHHKLLQKALKFKGHDNLSENSISSENWTLVTNKTNKTDDSTNKDSSSNIYSDLHDTENNSMTLKDDVLGTPKKTFCSHCNVHIVTKNLKKHTITKKHISNTISKYYYLFKVDLDIISCRVCDVIVNGVDDFERHVNSFNHDNKYKVLLSTNKIRKIDNNQLFCEACDKLVLIKNELYHIKGYDHIQCLDSNKDSTPDRSPNFEHHCNICDLRVGDIQLHNESMSHNLKKFTMTFDNLSTVKSNGYYYDYTMIETESPSLVNCSVCDVLVSKDEEIIQKHIEDENHQGHYKKLLQDHTLELDIGNIYCKTCKVFVGLKSEIMHLKGKRHLKNIEKTKEKSNVFLSIQNDTNFEVPINSIALSAKLEGQTKGKASSVDINEADMKIILEHFDISNNLKEIICKTCKVTVPFTVYNSSGHLGGSKHKQKLMGIEILNSENTSTHNDLKS